MRASFKVLFIIPIFFSTFLTAQTDSTSQFLGSGFDVSWEPNSLKVEALGVIGSSTLNSTMFSDYLMRETFTPKAKDRFLTSSIGQTNFISSIIGDVEYKLSQRIGVYVSGSSNIIFTGSTDLAKLALFGNAQFAGKNISSSNTTFLNYTNQSVGLSHLILKQKKWFIKARYGVNIVSEYNEFTSQELSIFTAEDGDYIDVKAVNMAYLESNDGLDGIGLDLDLNLNYSVNESNTICLELSNIQPTYLLNRNQVRIDTMFRFEGFEFNPFVSDSGQSFNEYLDSNLSTVTRQKETRTLALLPSSLRLKWHKQIDDKNALGVQLTTTQWGQFGYSFDISHGFIFGPKLKIQSSIGYGNYTFVQWNEAIEYRASSSMNVFAKAMGINSMFAPNYSHSYGIAIGFSNRF